MLYRNNNHFINCSYYSNNDKIKLSKNREGFMNKIEIDYKKTLKLVIIAIIAYWILNHYQIVLSLLSKLLSVLMPFIIGCMIAFVLNVLMIRIEKQLSKVIVNPKLKILKRVLSILGSIALVVGVVAIIIILIIPELVSAIKVIALSLPEVIDNLQNWTPKQLTKGVLKSKISQTDRKIYIWHILQNDGHFFLSMCLLYKSIRKYELKMESEIFKFMQRYYPMTNFDYTRQSHNNYYVVRKRWIELLQIINEKGLVSRVLTNIITSDSNLEKVFRDVECNVKEYSIELRKRSNFIKQKKRFIAVYQKHVSKSEDKGNFVNLYDICKEMRMSYEKFQIFLTLFYQEERLVRNIFFINIVSTIEQRKRFYIGNTPVMKIKITKNYGI